MGFLHRDQHLELTRIEHIRSYLGFLLTHSCNVNIGEAKNSEKKDADSLFCTCFLEAVKADSLFLVSAVLTEALAADLALHDEVLQLSAYLAVHGRTYFRGVNHDSNLSIELLQKGNTVGRLILTAKVM
jgi:hypothetical protein